MHAELFKFTQIRVMLLEDIDKGLEQLVVVETLRSLRDPIRIKHA